MNDLPSSDIQRAYRIEWNANITALRDFKRVEVEEQLSFRNVHLMYRIVAAFPTWLHDWRREKILAKEELSVFTVAIFIARELEEHRSEDCSNAVTAHK